MDETTSAPRTARQQVRRRRSWLVGALVAAATATAALQGVGIAPADAGISGYRITGTGGVGLKVRTDPYNVNAGVVAVLADGTAFTAECAVRGRNVSGNTVWHRISAPASGWISDFYTTTPGFNQYIPGEPDCANITTRETRALNWAVSVLGQANTNGDLGDSNHPWNGWCDNFVAHAYGRAASGYATAIAHFNDLRNRGLIHSDANPPAGALVFYAAASVNGGAGHVMLSEGNGSYISTAATVRRVSFTWPGAPYIGWAYANPEWSGR
ncbi:hypothetical protein [Virgisporangium aurantiacum]|uniref:Uncharacterized protein n=1 Tax=Virgisporangium aurantiacum TaxID=175570 RepID=A0A8J3Z594_9ACTN|nr:hypothetical protein [Virgisporangium aurantiacum]GIJ57706.1 hypothetical protein Vau01_052220 [Virgisporangium aurantiacum]